MTRIVLNKVDNVVALVYGGEGCITPTLGPGSAVRHSEFCYVVPSMETLNLGWLALLFPFVWRRWWSGADPERLRLLLGITGGALLCWVLLMFGNLSALTFAFQGSYATAALLFLVAATVIAALPRRVAYALVGLQVLYFLVVWIALVYAQKDSHVHASYLLLGVVGAVGAGAALLRMPLTGAEEPSSPERRERSAVPL